jgi:predicted AAA+ superfamily ATPase
LARPPPPAPGAGRTPSPAAVVVVTGLRQSGKSTFLQRERGLARRRYLTLDDPARLAAARADPQALIIVGRTFAPG